MNLHFFEEQALLDAQRPDFPPDLPESYREKSRHDLLYDIQRLRWVIGQMDRVIATRDQKYQRLAQQHQRVCAALYPHRMYTLLEEALRRYQQRQIERLHRRRSVPLALPAETSSHPETVRICMKTGQPYPTYTVNLGTRTGTQNHVPLRRSAANQRPLIPLGP